MRKLGVNIICRLGTKKKGKKKKVAHFPPDIGQGEVTGAYCIHHTKFFSYKVSDFGDLDAGFLNLYCVIYTCTVISVRVDGNQEAKRK